MKTLKTILVAAILAAGSLGASAFDPKKILGGSSNGESNPVTDIIGAVQNVIGGSQVSLESLVGNWKYSQPAISFKSDNLLEKAGGAAASAAIIGKLEPYYKKAGITSLKMTFNNDNTFTASVGKLTTSGTVTDNGDGTMTFSFQAFNKIPTGSMKATVEAIGSEVAITFDATKLMTLVEKVASVSGNSTIQTFSSLLNAYDGMNIGVKIKKTK